MRLSIPAYLRIVRASACYDLLVTGPFATPWSFALVMERLSSFNQSLGGNALPEFGVLHTLFACLLGSMVAVWSVMRLTGPSVRLGRFDGMTRVLVALWMGWALVHTGEPVLWLFMVPEIVLGVLQWLPLVPDTRVQGNGSSTARAPFTNAPPMRSSLGG